MSDGKGWFRGIKQPKYKSAAEYVLKRIGELTPGNNQLETEEKLAAYLGTSRATVRQAIEELIRNGYVSRIQGKGMFGHPVVNRLKMRMDQNSNFWDLLSLNGYRVSMTKSEAKVKKASERMLAILPEYRDKDVYAFQLEYYADDRPAILCCVEIPMFLVQKPLETIPYLTLKDMLKDVCNLNFAYTLVWLRAKNDVDDCRRFFLPPGCALTVWDELFYDLHDNFICYNEITFNHEIIHLSMVSRF